MEIRAVIIEHSQWLAVFREDACTSILFPCVRIRVDCAAAEAMIIVDLRKRLIIFVLKIFFYLGDAERVKSKL